jgi:LuxR family maltose regulon positive regulatory protein/serine/threonine-protein kinase PknK
MHSEADVVQACIDIYGDRIDRAEGLVALSLQRRDV